MVDTEKNEKTKLPEIVDERKLKCFWLKFKGHSYAQISEATGYAVRTLEINFWKQGKWYQDYIAWRKYQVEELNDQINNMFLAQSLEAQQQITNIAKGVLYVSIPGPDGKQTLVPLGLKGDTVLRAAQDILDRAGFKPKEKVEVTDPDDHADKLFDWFQKHGMKKTEKEPEPQNAE